MAHTTLVCHGRDGRERVSEPNREAAGGHFTGRPMGRNRAGFRHHDSSRTRRRGVAPPRGGDRGTTEVHPVLVLAGTISSNPYRVAAGGNIRQLGLRSEPQAMITHATPTPGLGPEIRAAGE